jgi:hypothetical protein
MFFFGSLIPGMFFLLQHQALTVPNVLGEDDPFWLPEATHPQTTLITYLKDT